MINNKYLNLIKDIIIFSVGNFVAKLIQFILLPLYTTTMSVESYGVAEVINSLSELLYPVVTFCIFDALFRFSFEEQYEKQEILTNSVLFIFSNFFISLLVLIVVNKLFEFNYCYYLFFLTFSYSIRMLFAFYSRGLGDSKLFALSGIINAISIVISNVVLLFWLRQSTNGYLLSLIISNCISALFLLFRGRYYKQIKIRKAKKNTLFKMLKYSIPLIIYNESYLLSMMMGRYILLFICGSVFVGLYVAVNKLAAIVNVAQQVFYYSFQINGIKAQDSIDSKGYFDNVFKFYSAFIFLTGSTIIALSPIIASLTLKSKFMVASIYLPLILYGAFIDCLFTFFKTLYTTYKKTKESIKSTVIGLIVNFVLCLILIPKMKIWGLLIATTISYLIMGIVRIYDTRRFVIINIFPVLFIPCFILITVQVLVMTINLQEYRMVSFLICFLILIIILIFLRNDLKRMYSSVMRIVKTKK